MTSRIYPPAGSFIAPTIYPKSKPNDCVFFLDMMESGGAKLFDQVKGKVGVITQTTAIAERHGLVRYFDGTSDQISFGNVTDADYGTAVSFTHCFWIKQNVGAGTYKYIFSKTGRDELDSVNIGWFWMVTTAGVIRFTMMLDTSRTDLSTAAVTAGVWCHMAVSVNRAGGATGAVLYLNGAAVATGNGLGTTNLTPANTPNLLISKNDTTQLLTGSVGGSFMMFKRALVASEIKVIYESEAAWYGKVTGY